MCNMIIPSLLSVFVLNHATSDDFQPGALREFHSVLAESLTGSRLSVAGQYTTYTHTR